MDRASVDLIRAPFSLTPEQEDELPPLPCDRHGRLVGATLEHVGVYIDAFTLCGLDDMDKVARSAFANRNGQGAQRHQKAQLKQQVRPILRQAIRHAANARTALLLGEIEVYEEERINAVEQLHLSRGRFLHIVAQQTVKQSRTSSANRKDKGVDKAAVKRLHARLEAQGEHDATSQTATHYGISTRRVRQILEE